MKKNSLIFCIYLFISSILTYPLITHLTNSIPGLPLDAFNYLWNIDTFWHELILGHSPFFTQRIFFPLGAPLTLHTYAPLISIPGVFFTNNLTFYMNILVLFSLAAAAFATYWVIKKITKNNKAAFISGLIYGFSPIMMSFIFSEHFYFAIDAFVLPLGIYFSHEILIGKTKNIYFLILLFWISFFIDYYTTVLYLIFIFLIFLVNIKTFLSKLKSSILSFILPPLLLLILPFLLFYLLLFKPTSQLYRPLQSPSYYSYNCSTKPIGYLIPSDANPFLKLINTYESKTFHFPYNFDTPSYFSGWIITASAVTFALLLMRKERIAKSIAISGIFIFLLSLGPNFEIFYLFSKLPFMGFLDCPLRFPIGVQASISLLIGLGLSKLTLNKKSISIMLIFISFLFVFFLEYFSQGIQLTSTDIPSVYKEIALTKNQKAVLELPSGVAESKGAFGYDWSIQGLLLKQLYWQTYYQKPRVGGYLSRLPENIYPFFKNEPIISDLFSMTSLNGTWDNKTFTNKDVDSFLLKFNIGYIILSPNQRQKDFETVVENLFKNNISQKVEENEFILYYIK